MLAARNRVDPTWLRAVGGTHVCSMPLGELATKAIEEMFNALCWAFSADGQVAAGATNTICARYGACAFCVLLHLFTAEEPSPPLWFRQSFGQAFLQENPDAAESLSELAQHLFWATLYTRGVRNKEDALRFIGTQRGVDVSQA